MKKHVNPDVYRRHVISRYEGTDTRIQKAKREDRKKNLNFDTCIHGFPGGSGKESACRCMRVRRRGFIPWVGKIPQRRKWQPTPLFLPGKSHAQRILVGYSPWGCKESNTAERLTERGVCVRACIFLEVSIRKSLLKS